MAPLEEGARSGHGVSPHHDVFISYSHQNKTQADAVCAILERDGLRCWIAPRDVQPGVEWATSIVRGINGASVFVLLFSSFANESGQVSREVERAANRRLPIIPFRIEDVEPSETLEFFISSPHWMDAIDPPFEAHIKRLSIAVRQLIELAKPPAERSAGGPAEAESASTPATVASRLGTEREQSPTKVDTNPHSHGLSPPKPSRWALVPALLVAGAAVSSLILVALLALRVEQPALEARAPEPFKIARVLRGSIDHVSAVAFSPDGALIVSGSWDDTIRFWEPGSGMEDFAPGRTLPDRVNAVAFASDGDRIVTGSDDHTIRIWNAATAEEIGAPLRGHTDSVRCVAFSPNGQRIVSGSFDDTIRIWDVATGQEIGAPFGREANSVAFSPDGSRIASGGGPVGDVMVWDAATRRPIETLKGHTAPVSSVAFSPDGRRVVSGSGDSTIRIWDAAAGKEIGPPLRGHTQAVTSVAFSPDGRRIVSGSHDATIRVWDAGTGNEISRPLDSHTDSVESVAFSPDGKRIVSGSDDGAVIVWDATGR